MSTDLDISKLHPDFLFKMEIKQVYNNENSNSVNVHFYKRSVISKL